MAYRNLVEVLAAGKARRFLCLNAKYSTIMKNKPSNLQGNFTLNYNHGATKVELPHYNLDGVLNEITNIYHEDDQEPDTIILPDGTEINYSPSLADFYWKSRITIEEFLSYSITETNAGKEVSHE